MGRLTIAQGRDQEGAAWEGVGGERRGGSRGCESHREVGREEVYGVKPNFRLIFIHTPSQADPPTCTPSPPAQNNCSGPSQL